MQGTNLISPEKTESETLTQALKKNPQNDKALFRKGKALGELGWIERAEKAFNELKARNPSGMFPLCYFLRSLLVSYRTV